MISEKKFIELLNLYLDHEISAEQVRVLEAEIRRDPARHTLYREYCAMHRGCLELSSAFAPQHERVPEIRPSRTAAVREFVQTLRPAGFGWGAWASGVGLAAACGALAFFVFSNGDRSGHSHDLAGREGQAGGAASAPAGVAVGTGGVAALASVPVAAVAPSRPYAAEGQATGRAAFANGRAAHSAAAAPASSAVFATTASAPVAAVQTLAAPASASVRPAAPPSAFALHRLHPVYSPGFPRSHAEARLGQPFSLFYTAEPSSSAAEANGRLEWAPLVNIEAFRARARPQPPSFHIQPALAPSPRMYRRQDSPPPEIEQAAAAHFLFQR